MTQGADRTAGTATETLVVPRAPHPGAPLCGSLRVLVLAPQPFYQQRGTPIAVRALLEVLAARGYSLEVLTYPEGQDPGIPGCRIIRIPNPLGIGSCVRPGLSAKKVICDAMLLARCFTVVRRYRPHVIHAVEEAAFVGAVMKRVFGIPFIYDMDSSLSQQMIERYPFLERARRWFEGAEARAIRASLGVIAVCRALEDVVRQHAPDKMLARLEDTSQLQDTHHGSERLSETIGSAGPIVMYVGNLERYQGINLLLEAFRHTAELDGAAQLVIIGGNDGDIGHYRGRARELGIAPRVHFVGPRPLTELGWYLGQADVLVSPRITGTNTPMKIYSYLDSGSAVLATRLPTHTQVLDDEIACLADAEPQAFGAELARLLADEPLRRALAASAAERVRREFSREAFERKVNAFYDSVEKQLSDWPERL